MANSQLLPPIPSSAFPQASTIRPGETVAARPSGIRATSALPCPAIPIPASRPSDSRGFVRASERSRGGGVPPYAAFRAALRGVQSAGLVGRLQNPGSTKHSARLAGGARAGRDSGGSLPDSADLGERQCVLIDLSDRLTPYRTAWEWQRQLVALRHQALSDRAKQQEQLEQLEQVEQQERQREEQREEQRGQQEQQEQGEAEAEQFFELLLDASRSGSLSSSSSSPSSSSPPSSSPPSPPDVLLLVQHPPVYTLGTRSDLSNLRFDPAAETLPGGAELFVTERGGEVTYHGPGQLVIYPILDLRRHCCDLHWYLRSLEEAIIGGLEDGFGIRAGREEGMTGVWSGGCKLAAIGVRVSRWVTFHGAALNVTTDLSAFGHIVPCGLTLPVGSVASHLLHRTHAAHSATADAAAAAAAAAVDADAAPGADSAAVEGAPAPATSAGGAVALGTAAESAAADGYKVDAGSVGDHWAVDEWVTRPDSGQAWEGGMMGHAAAHLASAFARVFSVKLMPLRECFSTTEPNLGPPGTITPDAATAAVTGSDMQNSAVCLARKLWLPEDLCRTAFAKPGILEEEVCEGDVPVHTRH
ncbi:hypothetical protein CLOM_g4523 [Closterium sp. NIES-68]|nr:hypothetical protein CLOM_g4523 [Closterium sp. NIES-68]GJP71390.1 hypothetical protein CLOP_g2225 [Closterium sp. NIES-67]